ncbi:DRTGG domain-containing protein [Paenibacillus marinisediminis]
MDSQEFTTKHEQIIQYIEELSVGARISVRKIAQALDVSDGTAYRAIKDAENRGIVHTKERTGTIRIEKKQHEQIDKLTFEEIAMLVGGEVLGGQAGLHKSLNKFVIGAMQLDAMIRYIEPGNLLIVGNRIKAHESALTLGAGVLITGGFDTTPEVVAMANELQLPVIRCSYDTFTTAALINRAIDDRMIKKQIMLVKHIIREDEPIITMREFNTVEQYMLLIEETNYNRFPVVDEANRPIGMITAKDVIGGAPDQTIDKLMTRQPLTVSTQTSIATAGHMMVWEEIELLPVIDENQQLVGIISRKDVLKAMQQAQMQPQNGETFDDQIGGSFEVLRDEEGRLFFRTRITAQMSNHIGNLSEGTISSMILQVVTRTVRDLRKGDLLIDHTSSYYLAPIEIDSIVDFVPTIIESSRRSCKVEVEVYCNDKRVVKSMMTARVVGPS